jgi:hypothetical protein
VSQRVKIHHQLAMALHASPRVVKDAMGEVDGFNAKMAVLITRLVGARRKCLAVRRDGRRSAGSFLPISPSAGGWESRSNAGATLPFSSLLNIPGGKHTVEPLDHIEPLKRRFEVAICGVTLDESQRELTSLVV